MATPGGQGGEGAEDFLFANAVSNCSIVLWAAAGESGEFDEDEVVEPPKPKPKPRPKKPKPKPKIKPKIKVNLNSNIRKPDARNTKAQKEAAKQREALNRSLNKLDTKLSDRTAVNVPLGRYASANYESLIRRKYMDATIHPGAISGAPVVKVRLVIARNGRIISARVTGQSGLASWDRAVQKALDRVKFIKPFPESMKGSQQTFNLNFNSRNFS